MKRRTICIIGMGIVFLISMGWILDNSMFNPNKAVAQNSKVLTANQLLIIDRKGKVRVSINPAGSNEEYTGFSLRDSNGVTRFVLQINPDDRPPTVTYFDTAGKKIDRGYNSSSPFYSSPAVGQAAFGVILKEMKRLSDEIEKLKKYHH